MKRRRWEDRTFFFIIFLSVFSLQGYAEKKPVELLFFYESGCPHCARIERFLNERIKPNYNVEIKKYEIHKSENARLLNRFAELYSTEVFTPSVIVGDTLIKGDERRSLRVIEESVRKALRANAPSPLTLLKDQEEFKWKISISVVLSAAIVDAINPCACAVLILLLLIYNLIFILPFIIITLGVGYGLTTTARMEMLRREKLGKIHLITGLIILSIGVGLILLVITGNI